MDVAVNRWWLVSGPDGTVRFYKNPRALSLGYGVSSDLLGATFVGEGDPFAEQNALVSKMLGRDVKLFVPMQADLTGQDSASCSWNVHVPEGFVGYMWAAHAEGPFVQTIGDIPYVDDWRWAHAIREVADARQGSKEVPVSLVRANPEFEVDMSLLASNSRFYALDWAAYEQVMSELSQHQAHVEEFAGNRVALSYEAQEDGVLLVSLPAEPGWSVEVNGRAVEPGKTYDGAMMLVPVSRGQNQIRLSFFTPGLLPSAAVSLVTLVGCLLVAGIGRRRKESAASG